MRSNGGDLKCLCKHKICADAQKQKRHTLRCVFEIALRVVLVSLLKMRRWNVTTPGKRNNPQFRGSGYFA